jgi:hypothetical protein
VIVLAALGSSGCAVEAPAEVEGVQDRLETVGDAAADSAEEVSADADDTSALAAGSSASCTAWPFSSCTTSAIPAHPTLHRIHVGWQDPWSRLEVFDVDGPRVYDSSTSWTPKSGTYIPGLYNWYYLKVTARDAPLVDGSIESL